jgi:hypothetical protein
MTRRKKMTLGFEPTPLSRTAESNLIRRLVDIRKDSHQRGEPYLRPRGHHLSFGRKIPYFLHTFHSRNGSQAKVNE